MSLRSNGSLSRTLISAALLLLAAQAQALTLGRPNVKSIMGEPLRAEIDITQLTAEEANSLKVGVASPEAFQAAGLDYSPVMPGVQVNIKLDAGGRSYLVLTSDRPLQTPYLDLLLQLQWASGRLLRDYTLLIDPVSSRPAASPPPLVAPAAPALIAPPVALPAPTPIPAAPVAPVTAPEPAATVSEPPATEAPAAKPAEPAKPQDSKKGNGKAAETKAATAQAKDKTYQVQAGDTLGKIAQAHATENVSMEQMLVSLFRNNPDAFIANNLNLVKSGAVMNVPDAEQAQAISVAEAKKIVITATREFNEYRSKMADMAATQVEQGAQRQASGRIEAKVQEPVKNERLSDKLTLSKGAQNSTRGQAEDKIAKTRELDEAEKRAQLLSKNLQELNQMAAKVAEGKPAQVEAPALPTVSAGGAAAPVGKEAVKPPLPPGLTLTGEAPPAPAPVAAEKPAPSAQANASALLSQFSQRKEAWPVLGGIAALLLAWLGLRLLRRKPQAPNQAPTEPGWQEEAQIGQVPAHLRGDEQASASEALPLAREPEPVEAAVPVPVEIDPVTAQANQETQRAELIHANRAHQISVNVEVHGATVHHAPEVHQEVAPVAPAPAPAAPEAHPQPVAPAQPAPEPAAAAATQPLAFDLSGLSLELGKADDEVAHSNDPLETKLALAQEFRAIGDIDGARQVLNEVVKTAEGQVLRRAQAMLSELS